MNDSTRNIEIPGLTISLPAHLTVGRDGIPVKTDIR